MADFLKVHGLLTQHTVKETGRWRSGGEGVYAGGSCIFMAPPPELVPSLMERLFRWLKANRKNVHPLIASSVFHFEMVFIHPFADGNGRLARYWQSALLGEWNPLFYYLPFENQIKDHQKDYYDAIALSENHGDSTAFVTFMLRMIDEALASLLKESQHLLLEEDPYVVALLKIMRKGESYSLRQLMDALHLSSRSSFLKNYLSKALAKGLVCLLYPESPHNPRQRYYRPK